MKLPRIEHEYILLWQKPRHISSFLGALSDMARQQSVRLQGTWRVIVRSVLMTLGGVANLSQIYEKVAENAPERLMANPNWKAKIRQTLNQNLMVFAPVDRGVWALAE